MTKLTCQQTESFLYKNPYPLTHLSSHVSRCKSAKFTNAHGYDTPSITTHSLYTPRDISIDYTLNEGRPRVTSITSIPTARQLYSNVHLRILRDTRFTVRNNNVNSRDNGLDSTEFTPPVWRVLWIYRWYSRFGESVG